MDPIIYFFPHVSSNLIQGTYWNSNFLNQDTPKPELCAFDYSVFGKTGQIYNTTNQRK